LEEKVVVVVVVMVVVVVVCGGKLAFGTHTLELSTTNTKGKRLGSTRVLGVSPKGKAGG